MESLLTTRPPARVPLGSPAPWPARRGRHSARRIPWGVVTAAILLTPWLVLTPHSPDLAGQVYRAGLFERAGLVLWDNAWYAGHHVPGYSLTWPWLASLLGVRATALTVLVSAYLFERLARRLYGPRTAPAAVLFALAAVADVWIGRLTFALGVTLALAAALAVVRARANGRRPGALAVLLGAASAATSPVAGLLLVLALSSWALGDAIARSYTPHEGRSAALWPSFVARLGVLLPALLAPLAVVLALQALFSEGGFEPYAASSVAAALAVTIAFMLALPRGEPVLLVGAAVYVVVNLLALAPATPMGSNIQRYGVLLAAPLLLCALAKRGGARQSRLPRWALGAALAGMTAWIVWGPVVQTLGVSDDPSTQAAYYVPVERFLARHSLHPLRIEVPFTRAHWEAAFLAPRVSLARGWERQLDKRYDLVLESHSLSAGAYRDWLEREGVSYVALPDVPFDQSSSGEVRLIRHGLPYMREVFRSAHWRIYRVLAASPLAMPLTGSAQSGRVARITALGTQGFALSVAAPGRYLVRVRYTPYWVVVAGRASVHSGAQGFTEVRATRAGAIRASARFSLGGAWRALEMALGLT